MSGVFFQSLYMLTSAHLVLYYYYYLLQVLSILDVLLDSANKDNRRSNRYLINKCLESKKKRIFVSTPTTPHFAVKQVGMSLYMHMDI